MKKQIENKKLKNKTLAKGLFAMLIVATLLFSLVPATAIGTNTISTDTTDSSDVKVTTKAKAASIKITWNGNGGKIGTKKSTVSSVKKGKKIGKFPTTPKLAGYTFKGWYTKKTGGTKITKNTKPKKKVTYFAQWTKITESSKLVGHWQRKSKNYAVWDSNDASWGTYNWHDYYFYADGRFEYYYLGSSRVIEKVEGKYSVSNGKVYFKERKFYKFGNDLTVTQFDDYFKKYGINSPKYPYKLIKSWPNYIVSEYKLGSDSEGTYLLIAHQRDIASNGDPNFVFGGDRYTKKITW